MKVGFIVTVGSDAVEFKLFEPTHNISTPLLTFAQTAGDTVVMIGRLFYRDVLLAGLATGPSIAQYKDNDAALALAVYRELGCRGLERLEGEFALVIWDARSALIIGLRDPMGGYPLFWSEYGDTFALGTMMYRLLDMLPCQVLDMEFLADFLTLPVQRNEGAGESCAYQGIHRILPGTILTWDVSTRRGEQRVYWDWLAQLQNPGSDRLEDMATQYRQVLKSAVQERLRGRTLSHLSGGMDSTTVVLLARDLIKAGLGEAPLHTLSLVYQRLPGLARELPYIETALTDKTAIVAHRMVADELLDFDSFADAPLHAEPYAALHRLAADRAPLQLAAAVGATTMLTGVGADDLLDMLPYHLAELLRQGRLRSAWREAVQWAQARNCSPWDILYPFGLSPLTPAWLRKLQAAIHSKGLRQQEDWSIPSWFAADFVQRYRLKERLIDKAHQLYHRCPQPVMSLCVSALSHLAGDVIRWSVATPLGIGVAHPFLDGRVLCLSLGIRSRLRPLPGKLKPVLAEAMRDILPAAIRDRRRKGHFNEIYYLGLARNLPMLEALVQEAPPVALEIFDKEVLLQALQEAGMAGIEARRLQRLNFTLALSSGLACRRSGHISGNSRPRCSGWRLSGSDDKHEQLLAAREVYIPGCGWHNSATATALV